MMHATDHYVTKHDPTRWLSMKQIGVRVLEQIENLSEYFLSFLPKKKGKNSERYERIFEQLKRPDIEAYLAFMLLASQDFESFLRFFQYDQWFTYSWLRLFSPLEVWCQKFTAKKQLFTKDDPKSDENIVKIDPLDKNVCKKASLTYVGTKSKVLFWA